ncbi:hypothetical protein GCM10029964_082060 [Kibdelosporangium lantanae]
MTEPIPLAPGRRLPLARRLVPLAAVAVARVLAGRKPARLRKIMATLQRGAGTATTGDALRARQEVVSVSLRCAGRACLQRSIAVALLCRSRGTWPTWCTGVRTSPFAAHAWVEVDGQPVGEPYPAGHFQPMIRI